MNNTPTIEQQNIINTTEGYVRCGAVPGSGKTFCITYRMAHLINDYFVDPSAIVALTFTNKAARSMTNRLKGLVGDEGTCFTGTFHGYCNKILKEEIYRLSWPKTFKMLDKKGQIDLVTEVADRLNLSLKDYPAKNYLDDIAKYKSSSAYIQYMIGPDKSLLLQQIHKAQTNVERVCYNYMLTQRDNFALDFHDIIGFAVYILQNYPDALATWQDKCMYLLCDEYQDVNYIQDQLLDLLSGKYRNLTVVGDDDQCIYGWRDSKVDFILEFGKKYPQAHDFYLTENFRSTPEIVAVANSLIKANQNRLSKAMFTNNPHGPKPVYNNEGTEQEEALWIAYTIEQAVKAGKQYSDHAILVRASSQTRALEEAFMRKKIPYRILSGAEFYASEEIRTVLSYLSMVYFLDDLDFTYTVNRPRRKYGKKSVEKLKEYAAQRNLTLMEALGEQINNGIENRQAIIDYYNNVMRLHSIHQNYSSKDIANMVLDFGYREALQHDVDQSKLDNVAELLDTIAAMEEDNQENILLSDLLAYFALFTSQDDDNEKNVVKIMTIHTSKGLEFDTVFVNGLVEGQFPSRRLRNQDELEEERRLFYVAITRAKNNLYLSSYDVKVGSFTTEQSSFLRDIDINLLDCINNSTIGSRFTTPMMLPKSEFEVGDMVLHKGFGQGIIIGVDEKNQTYEIKFDNIPGTRRIQFRAAMNVLKKLTTTASIIPYQFRFAQE